jgi:hypothetical protein
VPGKYQRNGGRLNGRRFGVAGFLDSFQNSGFKP